MPNELVRDSRAGDEFHYRWATRRCLELLRPQSLLKEIYLEGDSNKSANGEYVLDMTEVYSPEYTVDKIGYQLKYTTRQLDMPFSISHLGTTLLGFAQNFKDPQNSGLRLEYTFVTNRPVSEKIKETIAQICEGKKCSSSSTYNSILHYTGLPESELANFCRHLKIRDHEGNLSAQTGKLQFETSMFLAQNSNNALLATLIAMVRNKATSTQNHKITKEDVLVHFDGVSTEKDLFPAQPIWDPIPDWITRTQYDEIKKIISKTAYPVILHAAGGVGKTVVMRQLYEDIPNGSIALIYDCFGSGQYRNPATPRHRHRDALVQLLNELAQQGLCYPLIPQNNDFESQYLFKFWETIRKIIADRRQLISDSCLYLFIDAADNAEMIAQEYRENCFVHDLLHSDIPDGCKLILSCRTERLESLKAYDSAKKILLNPFDDNETLSFLNVKFQNITISDSHEVNSFTGGNPRIIANLLADSTSIRSSLSPNSPKTMEEFLDNQIEGLINRLQRQYPRCEYVQFTTICQCLALLPPSIPVVVLAVAADVPVSLIESFIADLGYPLWHENEVVHFRDEPTETWFRDKYGKETIDLSALIDRLKTISEKFAYVSEALPRLLHLNGRFDELMLLATSKNGIPKDNPTELRNIYLARLEYAVRAAINLERYNDVSRLAFLAGEELACKDRQDELLQNNLPLTANLLSIEQVLRLAWSKKFKSTWRGSETLYSAALLSFLESSRDNAKGLLRSADNWIRLYYERKEMEDSKERGFFNNEELTTGDIYAFALTILNLNGPGECAGFVSRWSPSTIIFDVSILIAKYLVDLNDITAIEKFVAAEISNPYIVLAACYELRVVNQFLKQELLIPCLDILSSNTCRLDVEYNTYDEKITPSIIAFCESASSCDLDHDKIIKILDFNYLSREKYSHYSHNEKHNRIYLKAFSLKNYLSKTENDFSVIINEIKESQNQANKNSQSELEQVQQELTTLLPWYELRCKLIIGADIPFPSIEQQYRTRRGFHYSQEESINHERSLLFFDCIALCKDISTDDFEKLCSYLQDQCKLYVQDYIDFSYTFFRNKKLIKLAHKMLLLAINDIQKYNDELDVTEEANYYAELADAIYCYDKSDAQAYFETAMEKSLKYGKDMLPRWKAINALALRAAETNNIKPEMFYRVAQCGEFIRSKVVRDKYFDQQAAFATLFRMSPTFAIATFSRRRDRNVGYFEEELIYVLENCLNTKLITSDIAWAFRGFIHETRLFSLGKVCVLYESSHDKRKILLTSLVDSLVTSDNTLAVWEQLDKLQAQYNCNDHRIKEYITALQTNEDQSNRQSNSKDEKDFDWDNFIGQIDFFNDHWLTDAKKRYEEQCTYCCNFYYELFLRFSDNKAKDVLTHITNEQGLSYYDTIAALKSYPALWREKPGVQRDWQTCLEKITQKFAKELSVPYSSYHDLCELSSYDDDLCKNLLWGLKDHSLYAENYFAMIQHSASLLSPSDAENVLEFGISRFEQYIPRDFGDGPYSSVLTPSKNIIESLAGFIWSALGSPDLKICWDAAHSVVNFFYNNDDTMIASLFECLKNKKVSAFGSPKYPFYEFNAILYFMIALARVASDSINKILSFKDQILEIAQASNHILIKKFASEIIGEIEQVKNNDANVTKTLINTQSKFPPRRVVSYSEERIDSPWHLRKEVNKEINFTIDYDIKKYWLTSLGRVFGIAEEQLADLLKEIIADFRENGFNGSWNLDPRSSLWKEYAYRNRIYHSHSSSPEVQSYEFYLCYHGIMILANKLFSSLPVVQYGDEPNRWRQWLSYHTLTRSDGKWLADRRDAIPMFFIVKNDLLSKCRDDKITDIDIKALLFWGDEGTISIYGNWDIKDYGNSLTCKINCALISPSNAKEILYGLSMIKNPYEYRIPMYSNGREMLETPTGNFYWSGIIDAYAEIDAPKLDAKDPHCSNLSYPPHGLGRKYVNEFNLVSDSEYRHWQLSNGENVIDNIIWSSGISINRNNADPDKQGELVNISNTFLREICVKYKKSLIIEVILIDHSKFARDNDSNMRTNYFVFAQDGLCETLR